MTAERAPLPSPSHAWVDGALVSAHEPQLSVSDRGFQLGDGIFETLRARRGVVIELDEHLDRLHQSARILAIPLPAPDGRLAAAMADLLAAEGLDGDGRDGRPVGDAALRITISRGPIERRGLLPAGWEGVTATVVIQAWAYAPPPDALLSRGARAISSTVRRDPSSPLTGVKSTSRADYVHAKLEAQRAGVDDALFLTLEGHVSEMTTANVFAHFGHRLVTPPLISGILPGTTRSWILAHAGRVAAAGAVPGSTRVARPIAGATSLRLEPAEEELLPADLIAADEAFLSSSVAGIVPLVALDGQSIGGGRPGPLTVALRAARERWIDEESLRVLHAASAGPTPS